jgi:hypothetical protein
MNQRILNHIGFRPNSYNQIFFEHMEDISEFLEEYCPLDKKKCVHMLRAKVGVGDRGIKEHIDNLIAWDIVGEENKILYWIFEGRDVIPSRCREKKEPMESPQQKEGKCKYDLEKHGMCEKREIIKSKATCEACTEVILLD